MEKMEMTRKGLKLYIIGLLVMIVGDALKTDGGGDVANDLI